MYELTKQIHKLLPQVCAKNNIEKIKIEGPWHIHPQRGLFLATEIMEVMGKKNWQRFLDECYLAIQEKEIRQILIGLQEVLKNENYIINKKHTISADFDDNIINIKAAKYQVIIELENYKLYKKWCCGFPTSLFDREPETVLQELADILKDLLK